MATPFGKPKWMKAGFLGFPKSGKTYTAISLACGLHKLTGCKRPLQVYDSEGGFEYQADRIRELTGMDPDGVMAQNFVDLIAYTKQCQSGDICIIDSVTHPWRELLEAKQEKMGRFRGIMSAKETWTNEFSAWFLGSSCHVIICGRAGYIFAEEEDDKGEMKLVTKGTKMKTESELGFEPSLLVEMERDERNDGTLRRIAIVKGDRFGVIDGKRFADPTFDSFKEFISRLDLTTGGKPGLNTAPKTVDTLSGNGQSEIQKEMQERKIILEEIKTDIISAFPGQSAPEKKGKVDSLKACFGTASWTRLESHFKSFPADKLREGRVRLYDYIEAMKAEAEVAT